MRKEKIYAVKTVPHFCHAEGCKVQIVRERFMCARHWRMLPGLLKAKIYAVYRPGQCDDKRPSREWISLARKAQEIVAKLEGELECGDGY